MPGRVALAFAQIVLLVPVEIRDIARIRSALAGGNAHRPHMDPVGFRALQQGNVPELFGGPFQGIEEVAQHPIVGIDLLRLLPSGDKPGTLVQGRKDDVRDLRES
jgi:hypothetical protein